MSRYSYNDAIFRLQVTDLSKRYFEIWVLALLIAAACRRVIVTL